MSGNRVAGVVIALGSLGFVVQCGMLGRFPDKPPASQARPGPIATEPTQPTTPPSATLSSQGGKLTAASRIQEWKARVQDFGEAREKHEARFTIGYASGDGVGADGLPERTGMQAYATDEGLLEQDEPCTPVNASSADIDGDGRQDLLVLLDCFAATRGPFTSVAVIADRPNGPVALDTTSMYYPLIGAEWSARFGKKATLDLLVCPDCETGVCVGCPDPGLDVLAWDGEGLSHFVFSRQGKLTHQAVFAEGDARCASLAEAGSAISPWVAHEPTGQSIAAKCKCAAVEALPGLFCCPWTPEDAGESISDCPSKSAAKKATKKDAK
jgi:hypothetical protein